MGAELGCLEGKGALGHGPPHGHWGMQQHFTATGPCSPKILISRRGSRPHTPPACQSQAQRAQAQPRAHAAARQLPPHALGRLLRSHPHTQAPSPAAHTGTWPELACLGKGGQLAAPPQPREPLFAAPRRPHPGLSRSCGVEKGVTAMQHVPLPAHGHAG